MFFKLVYIGFWMALIPAWAFAKTVSLPALEAQSATLHSWQADFTQITTVAALGDDVRKTGKISVEKPEKFNIQYQSEPAKTYIYNGKKLWIHQIQSESVLQYDNPESLVSSEALSFLSGLEKLSELFTEAASEELPAFAWQNRKLATLALKPLSDNASIAYLVLGLDDGLTTREAFIWTPGGNQTHYVFSNVQKNLPLDSTLFSWTDRKGVKLIKQ